MILTSEMKECAFFLSKVVIYFHAEVSFRLKDMLFRIHRDLSRIGAFSNPCLFINRSE